MKCNFCNVSEKGIIDAVFIMRRLPLEHHANGAKSYVLLIWMRLLTEN